MSTVTTNPRIAIVGAGVSGLCAALQLRARGIDTFTMFERADRVGGTWRDNTYPGLVCDVPSRYYSFSFATDPSWSHVFAPGEEIQAYLERLVDHHDLARHLRLSTSIEAAVWDESTSTWALTLDDGSVERADVLVAATGVLRDPNIPAIPGLDDFAGDSFHSARWDHDVATEGRRVGVIGSGSTGVQITTAVAPSASEFTLFMRTPHWVMPLPNLSYSSVGRRLLGAVPRMQQLGHRGWQLVFEHLVSHAAVVPGRRRDLVGALCKAALHRVRDPELRAAITPTDDPLCKRLVISGGFHPAIQLPHVTVERTDIERVTATGITTVDGTHHELDVLVLATGFHAQRFMRPMAMTGRDGRSLDDAWADGPRGYLTVAQPGFPNLFTLQGPHSPVGNQSLIQIAETQAAWIVDAIEIIRDRDAVLAPTEAATDAFNDELTAQMPNTAWTGGCDSWYLDANGNPTLWPFLAIEHRRRLAAVDLDDFEVTARAPTTSAAVSA